MNFVGLIVLFQFMILLSGALVIFGIIFSFIEGCSIFSFPKFIKKILKQELKDYILSHPEKFDFEIFDLGQNDPYGKMNQVNDFLVKARFRSFSYTLFWTRQPSIKEVKDFIKNQIEGHYKESHKTEVKLKPAEVVKITLS